MITYFYVHFNPTNGIFKSTFYAGIEYYFVQNKTRICFFNCINKIWNMLGLDTQVIVSKYRKKKFPKENVADSA